MTARTQLGRPIVGIGSISASDRTAPSAVGRALLPILERAVRERGSPIG